MPKVVIIAGPNGAGKSTVADSFCALLGVDDFVNADVIARGLSAHASDRVAVQAGRIMLDRLHDLADSSQSLAFETTLSSRTFAAWIDELRGKGYESHLVYIWLTHPDLAVSRVKQRVDSGGHHIPEPTIRRRYDASLRNFFRLYRPRVSRWRFYDNSALVGPKLVAAGDSTSETVYDGQAWAEISGAPQSAGRDPDSDQPRQERILDALARHSVELELWRRKQLYQTACAWVDGKVVWVRSNDIPIYPPENN